MAEDELFDLNLKKKKKKKKVLSDAADSGDNEEHVAENDAETKRNDEVSVKTKISNEISEAKIHEDGDKEPTEEEILDEFSLKGKKKKKKKPFDLSDMSENLPKEEAVEEGPSEPAVEQNQEVTVDDSMDFSLPAKKKKKKKKGINIGEGGENDETDETGGDAAVITAEEKEWHDSDRDYKYDELLKRVFDIMREKNPDLVAGEKKRFVMKPPQVVKVGTKKTSFVNFAEIARLLHRQPKHLLAFLLAELGTSGSLDGTNQLIIKGRFQQKQIETVLRRYIKEYVSCHTCKSPETSLQKDTRLYFLQCETCGSRCSVASIKSGFQAVTGKRAAIRAKTT